MIEPAPAESHRLLDEIHLPRRLAARLGALAARGLRVSWLVAEEAAADASLASLLLAPGILEAAHDAARLAAWLASPENKTLAQALPLSVAMQDGAILLAASEEWDANDGSPDAAASGGPAVNPHLVPAISNSRLSPTPSLPAQGPIASSEAPSGLERLRVAVFAGSSFEEKAAALRRLVFLQLPREQVAPIFFQALADADAGLSAAAARGLAALGLAPEISEAARLVAEGTPTEQIKAAGRLADLAVASDAFGADAVFMALAGALRRSASAEAPMDAIHMALAQAAPALGIDRLGTEDFIRTLLDEALRAQESRWLPISRVLQAIEILQPRLVAGHLEKAIIASGSPEYRGTLFRLLADLDFDHGLWSRLAPLAVDTFLRLPATGTACQQTARFIWEEGNAGLALFSETLPDADAAHQRFVIRMLDNITCHRANAAPMAKNGEDPFCQDGMAQLWPSGENDVTGLPGAAPPTPASPDDIRHGERMGQALLAVMRAASRQVKADLLETRLVPLPGFSESLRGELAAALVSDPAEYDHWQLAEGVEWMLRRLGPPAVPAALRALEDGKKKCGLDPVAAALGTIARALSDSPSAEGPALAADIARSLHVLGYAQPPWRDSLHRALGRVAGSPRLPKAASGAVWRTLRTRLAEHPSDDALLDGLSLAASGAGADPEGRQWLADTARGLLERSETGSTSHHPQEGDADIYLLDDALWNHASVVPSALRALGRLASWPEGSPALADEITIFLLGMWEKVTRFDIVWGPANSSLLTALLGDLGRLDHTSPKRRLQLAKALASRPGEPADTRSLAVILARRDPDPGLDRLALVAVGHALDTVTGSGDGSGDHHEIWPRLLAHLAWRGRFGLSPLEHERLCGRVVDALAGIWKNGVSLGLQSPLSALAESGALPSESARRLMDAVNPRQIAATARRSKEMRGKP